MQTGEAILVDFGAATLYSRTSRREFQGIFILKEYLISSQKF